ncbi:hypothetical protein N7453_003625 [Penicillium expansum]|nr:hypothetical protein N7453_003625 [Penicillium expansum]
MAHYFPFRRKKPTDKEKAEENLIKRYDGEHHRSSGMRFQRPSANPETIHDRLLELEDTSYGYGKKKYLNPNGDDDHEKYTDMDTYYSTNKEYPRRLVVQAAPELDEGTEYLPRQWGRRPIRGRVPFIITLAELCLNPFGFHRFDGVRVKKYEDERKDMSQKQNNLILKILRASIQILSWIRSILIALISSALHWITSILLTLTLSWIVPVVIFFDICTPPWSENGPSEPYKKYQNVYWHWPKHAMNPLDQSPDNYRPQSNVASLTIPSRLVVKDQTTNQWTPKKTKDIRDKKTGMLQPYIFLSFSRANYPGIEKEELRKMLYQVAERMLQHENLHKDPHDPPLEAFWMDIDCVSEDKSIPARRFESEYTRDVNSICDAVRCAKRSSSLPTESDTVSPILNICLCYARDVTLSDMKQSFWERIKSNSDEHEDEDAVGCLINHYTNSLQLSELQLFTFAVQAMAMQTTSVDTQGYETKHMAYAAMGLLSYRLTPNDSDNVFQAIARLSIVNDSNQLLERLLCLSPDPKHSTKDRLPILAPAGSQAILRNIADKDQYGTHLWDIKPICDVVGVGNDSEEPTVIINRCRGIPIRWKNFPKLKYTKGLDGGISTAISKVIIYLGIGLVGNGFALFPPAIALAVSVIPWGEQPPVIAQMMEFILHTIVPRYLLAVPMYLGIVWIISWFCPWAVRKLCSDVQGSSNHLVGFEGTMSLHDLEKTIYGNFNDRLSYTASSTVFSGKLRHKELRMSKEPIQKYWRQKFEELKLPKTHRIFTLVDTGNMTVSVISAERPPVVALICGREGGMLRVLLCSWRFETNCLYREGVVRMRSSLEEQATPNDWLKISLASQGDVNRTRLDHLKRTHYSTSTSSPLP